MKAQMETFMEFGILILSVLVLVDIGGNMKNTICIPIFGIVLAMFACVATAYEICKEFATYYTYCDDDYYCCLADSSCCYSSSGGIFGGSGSFPTTSSYVLSGGAIAGIVLGCTLFMVGLTICIKAMKGNSKTGQGRSVIGPVRVAPVQLISTGATSFTTTHPLPYSHTVRTGHAAYSQSLPGAVNTEATQR